MPSEGDEAADAAAIDMKLLSLRKQSGTLRVVTGRGLQRSDTVICDFDAGTSCHWCKQAFIRCGPVYIVSLEHGWTHFWRYTIHGRGT